MQTIRILADSVVPCFDFSKLVKQLKCALLTIIQLLIFLFLILNRLNNETLYLNHCGIFVRYARKLDKQCILQVDTFYVITDINGPLFIRLNSSLQFNICFQNLTGERHTG